jgi:cytochrome b561
MENLGRSFSFMFEDADWVQKILIGAAFCLLSLVLIGIPFVIGYLLQVARQSSEGKELPLPAWDNLGDKFISGLLFIIVGVLYAIPMTILYFLLIFIPCIGWLAMIAIGFAFALVFPYITVRFARSGNIGDAFDLNGIWNFLKNNLGNLLIVWLLAIVFQIIAWFGLIALLVGVLFTYFWAQIAVYYLYGRVVYEGEKTKPTAGVASAGL